MKLLAKMTRKGADQKGMTLIVVFLLFAFMATAAAAVLLSARRDIQVAGRDREQSLSLFTAEAGIAYAKNYLSTQWTPADRWTNVLNDATLTGPGLTVQYDVGGMTVGGQAIPLLKARYNYKIRNNANDPSGSATQDDDGIVIVTSTGEALDAAGTKVLAKVVVEVAVEWKSAAAGKGDYNAQQNQSGTGVSTSPDTNPVDTGSSATF